MSHLVDGRPPTRFQRLREIVARRWAVASIARLSLSTRDMASRWSSDCYTLDRDPLTYVAAMPAAPTAPYAHDARGADGTPHLETPHASRRDIAHAARVRRYYRLADQAAEARAIYRGGLLSPALHRETWTEVYGPNEYEHGAASADQPTDVQVFSTTYKRVVGTDDDGARVVSWMACDDPMYDAMRNGLAPRHLRDLERSADAFLRAADERDHYEQTVDALLAGKPAQVPDRPTLLRLDVLDRNTRQPTVAPDRLAFRGVVRYKRPQPCRYSVAKPAKVLTFPGDLTASDDALHTANVLGTPAGETTVRLYRTDMIGAEYALIGCAGRGWQGFKILTGPEAREARRSSKRRAATAVRRGNATGKRGVARNAWNLAERSLPRAWARADAGQIAAAEVIERVLIVLGGAWRGDPLTIGEDHPWYVVADDATAYVADETGAPITATYSHRSLARRAALARLDVA